jgi:hypothetical protein
MFLIFLPFTGRSEVTAYQKLKENTWNQLISGEIRRYRGSFNAAFQNRIFSGARQTFGCIMAV